MAEYDVVLLVEQVLSAQDAAQVRGLHEAIEEPVTYHVLVPVEDSATQIESGMGALAGGEVLDFDVFAHAENSGELDSRQVAKAPRPGFARQAVCTRRHEGTKVSRPVSSCLRVFV